MSTLELALQECGLLDDVIEQCTITGQTILEFVTECLRSRFHETRMNRIGAAMLRGETVSVAEYDAYMQYVTEQCGDSFADITAEEAREIGK